MSSYSANDIADSVLEKVLELSTKLQSHHRIGNTTR